MLRRGMSNLLFSNVLILSQYVVTPVHHQKQFVPVLCRRMSSFPSLPPFCALSCLSFAPPCLQYACHASTNPPMTPRPPPRPVATCMLMSSFYSGPAIVYHVWDRTKKEACMAKRGTVHRSFLRLLAPR